MLPLSFYLLAERLCRPHQKKKLTRSLVRTLQSPQSFFGWTSVIARPGESPEFSYASETESKRKNTYEWDWDNEDEAVQDSIEDSKDVVQAARIHAPVLLVLQRCPICLWMSPTDENKAKQERDPPEDYCCSECDQAPLEQNRMPFAEDSIVEAQNADLNHCESRHLNQLDRPVYLRQVSIR